MNEVNIMFGIDFKSNQKRMRDRQSKIKQERKLKNTVLGVMLCLLFMILLIVNKKMADSALDSCQNLGYSTNYCKSHL